MTISPPAAIFESTYERLVLLLAGSVLECSARDALNSGDNSRELKEGRIIGVVASRRARGDRIELWLGGNEQRTPAPPDWIDKVKESVSVELGMPEVSSRAPEAFPWTLFCTELSTHIILVWQLRNGKYKKHFS